MEPITLISTAMSFAVPYLVKTGEVIAEKVGEEIWEFLKKPFTKEEEQELFVENPSLEQMENIKTALQVKLDNDPALLNELKELISKSEQSLSQQNINNHGTVEKQVNIQTNTGDINL